MAEGAAAAAAAAAGASGAYWAWPAVPWGRHRAGTAVGAGAASLAAAPPAA